MSLLLKVKPLVVSPELASRIGLNEAIVLQQICYWLEDTTSGVEYDGKRWVYNTIEEWTEQFPFWSEKTVKRALTSLKSRGLIYVEQLKKTQHDRTNYYAINHANPLLTDGDKLTPSTRSVCPARKGQSVPMDKANMSPSIGSTCPDLTENTTENTTEITGKDSCQVSAKPDSDCSEDAFRVLEHLNRAAGLRYQKSKSSLGPIRGRLSEDFSADELILTVDYTIAKWSEDPKMSEFVRPETIFRPGKFPGYLSSAQKWDRAGRPPCINGKWMRDVTALPPVDSQTPPGFRGA
ncbi:conserved phage C-terminal domain-containing protein [Pantoea allii]|uniref:conserved phage C-terminal domain-containing protein n=1 Tax=Pantoea allii TaxID=574096 RepID=UPI000A2332C9|nr:conserved phage C-terminal domain-containing protein [Pantoea allii]MBW1251979.1 conserved phage C-terminal domain-containing protein [Pantoea allii]MBW1260576.1 conserved phage C-terminal domain-containing protein [Pantoea allii]MBW1283173.1 conserved phage C-terminal domain-containing protein [Pantoea allii]ORM84832.1 transcriptional regulator [Pantoea allii]PBJ98698.1 transcriptional regulator [Pantoea allii]